MKSEIQKQKSNDQKGEITLNTHYPSLIITVHSNMTENIQHAVKMTNNAFFPLRSSLKRCTPVLPLHERAVFENPNGQSSEVTLLSTSLQLICDWTMYMSESTSPEHSLSFLLASLRSELTFLRAKCHATN